MANVDRRTAAKMEMVLEEVFGGVLHGGDHESRKRPSASAVSARFGPAATDNARNCQESLRVACRRDCCSSNGLRFYFENRTTMSFRAFLSESSAAWYRRQSDQQLITEPALDRQQVIDH